MPPKTKESKTAKQKTATKAYLPPNSNIPRDPLPKPDFPIPEIKRKYEHLPTPLFREWNEEELESAEFNIEETNETYKDDQDITLPPSYYKFEKNIKWMRPKEYLAIRAKIQREEKIKEEKKTIIKGNRKSIRQSTSEVLEKVSPSQASEAKNPGNEKKEENEEQLNEGKELKKEAKVENVKQDSKNNQDEEKEPLTDINIVIIQMKERDETQKEMEQRIAQALEEAKEKKGGKQKGKPEPAQIQKIKEVQMENMDMKIYKPLYCKWASSQIQFIKDRGIRDCFDKTPVWKRIYPQQNGIPVYNPYGKYWVKLHHLGQERIVEIDDRMPCDHQGNVLMPETIFIYEIWPALLLKAIMKLTQYQWNNNAEKINEVGDPFIVHCLSGLLPEIIELNNFQIEKFPLFQRLLSDDHYFNKKTYLTCFCMPEFKSTLASVKGKPENAKEAPPKDSPKKMIGVGPSGLLSSGQRNLLKMRKYANMALSVTSGKKLNDSKDKPSYVIGGFGYSMLDIFENDNFDMTYVVKEDKDLIEEARSPYSPKKKGKKRAAFKDNPNEKKGGKDNQSLWDSSSRYSIKSKRPIKKYQFIKIKTSAANFPILNFVCPFSQDEIKLAKKCILNKQEKPADYDQRFSLFLQEIKRAHTKVEPKQENVKEVNKSNEITKENISEISKNEDNELNEEDKKEEEEEKEKVLLEPKTRSPGGLWMEAMDFPTCFQYVLAYYNPRMFKSKSILNDLWSNSNECFIPNFQQHYLEIKKASPEELASNDNIISEEFKDITQDNEDEKTKLIIGFCPNGSIMNPKEKRPTPFVIMNRDKVEIFLRSSFMGKQTNLLNLQNEESIIPIIYGPFGYTLWALSNNKVNFIPKLEYLCENKQYIKREEELELPDIHFKYYYLLFKYLVQVKDSDAEAYFKIDIKDREIINSIRFRLYEDDKYFELYIHNPLPIKIIPDKKYYLVADLIAPYNSPKESYKLSIVTSKEVNLEKINLDESYEYGDIYKPYKYGVLFRERIYVESESILSLHLRIRKGGNLHKAPEETKAKPAKKGKEVVEAEEKKEPEESEISEKRSIALTFYDNKKPFKKISGCNQLSEPHFTLFPFEEGKHDYILEATFDLQEWPECTKNNSTTENLQWIIKIYSSSDHSIFRDTEKEDREAKIKESWEEAQPGRSELSKKARRKFLAK